ncbi:MAG: dTDP-4-dehydrorhamnose 3,5-epimerase [Candidatus Andersenbacteria bacterium]|nr:dTDP-4-dehydrorhamnose 3,5-epimerase [Candidatus Andersenbacteria bacterium]
MPLTFTRLSIDDVVEIQPQIFQDERGVFAEIFTSSAFQSFGLPSHFTQFNRSVSSVGVLRGLHYQLAPAAQGKLIGVVRGEIFDVAVDLRRSAKSFGQWVSVMLSSASDKMVYIPAGFAHGFYVLSSEGAEVLYFCTAEYAPALERGILWNDPALNIRWPQAQPQVSARDAAFPVLQQAEVNFD